MTTKFWNAWQVDTGSIRKMIADCLDKGEIESNDLVFVGDDGSVAVAETTADLEENQIEMTESGTVTEFLNE